MNKSLTNENSTTISDKHSAGAQACFTFVLKPHLHLIVEVREQGPQLPSWHSFSHRWMVSEITQVLSFSCDELGEAQRNLHPVWTQNMNCFIVSEFWSESEHVDNTAVLFSNHKSVLSLVKTPFVALPYRWIHRPEVCCMSSHRTGWDRSSSVFQNSPVPRVWSAASDRRDTSSPGLGSEGMAGTGHDGTPAGTGELHSLTSW